MIDRARHQPERSELAAMRARLAGQHGPQYWRSLEELAQTDEFLNYVHREFPEHASEWHDPIGRRRFLQLMGASMALAGISGCVMRPEEKIVPYVRAPEQIIPGRPLFFATAAVHDGFGTGVLAESHMGRPTKLEGNPDHPASLGATDAFTQASILTLYDPDRSQVVTQNGRVSTWDNFLNALIGLRTQLLAAKGARLRILTRTITSPTLARLLNRLFDPSLFPDARWHQYDPVGHHNTHAGALLAFGQNVATVHHLDRADVIVSLDADLFGWGADKVRAARAWADRREAAATEPSRANRLYAFEPCPTITGAAADHRFPLPPNRIHTLAQTLAHRLGVANVPAPSEPYSPPGFDALVDDLHTHRGKCLIVAGETQEPATHALVHAINAALGNVGQTLTYHEPVAAQAPEGRDGTLSELVEEINNGRVEALLVLGGNPLYDAPADLNFPDAFARVPNRIHLGLYADETAQLSHWHIPEAHFLESWGDVRAFDGTTTIIQPLIAPLYEGHTPAELLSALIDGTPEPPRTLVETTWRGNRSTLEFEDFWQTALRLGVVANSAAPALTPTLKPLQLDSNDRATPATHQADGQTLTLLFRPDPSAWDGQYANNGWLQELPRPLSKLVWDNALQISPSTAAALALKDGDLVQLSANGRRLDRVAVLITPGHDPTSATLTLGYGRTQAGRVGNGTGFNAYTIRPSHAPWNAGPASIRKLNEHHTLATTQMHFNILDPSGEAERRRLVRSTTLADFRDHPDFASDSHGHSAHPEPHAHAAEHHPTRTKGAIGGHHPDDRLIIFEYPEPMQRRINGEGNAWGMSINLNTCVGCNACVVACQAENNIPIVGKSEVLRGREMHWIRIDRYYATREATRPEANPGIHFQPVLCMHCETAPCEIVCPVAATTHSAEGLNEMTYNRCVGTRYCSNNCPYKVRRFNFFQYADHETNSLKLQRNPNVSVRTRGVMEKCTYCVQRINAARIASEIAGEPRVPGNAIQTACQQACPTRAIVFGNLNDPGADVVQRKASPRDYGLIAELNTRPRTTYLAKLTNPNPSIET